MFSGLIMKCHLTFHLHGVENMIEFSFLGEHVLFMASCLHALQ